VAEGVELSEEHALPKSVSAVTRESSARIPDMKVLLADYEHECKPERPIPDTCAAPD
jgi:hypothetical protein